MNKTTGTFAFVLAMLLTGCGSKTILDSDTSSLEETKTVSEIKEVPTKDRERSEEKTEESLIPEKITTSEELSTTENVTTSENTLSPELASTAEKKYWIETTALTLEKPGQYELESTITNENYEVLSITKSTGDVSFYCSTEGCDNGYMQTVITAKNIFRYSDLSSGNLLCIKFGPVDLYTGKAFEDYTTPDESFYSPLYIGEETVSNTISFTTSVDGIDYDINWFMKIQHRADGRTEVYYITHPIAYNGIGFLLSGSWSSNEDREKVIARADEVGGWSNMRMEDYFAYLSTPHIIDCRNVSQTTHV